MYTDDKETNEFGDEHDNAQNDVAREIVLQQLHDVFFKYAVKRAEEENGKGSK